MGQPTHQFKCSWHTMKRWEIQTNSKIKNVHLKHAVLNQLHGLLKEKKKKEFNNKFENFLQFLDNPSLNVRIIIYQRSELISLF